jgi:hypothetical protein
VLESEPDFAYRYAEDALAFISKRLCVPDLDEAEREAIGGAIHSLSLIRSSTCQVAA